MIMLCIHSNDFNYINKTINEQLPNFVEKNIDDKRIQQLIDAFQTTDANTISDIIKHNCYWDWDTDIDEYEKPMLFIVMFAPLLFIEYSYIIRTNKHESDFFNWE